MSQLLTQCHNLLLILAFLFTSSVCGYAATYTSLNSGSWATSTTWHPAGVPAPGDDVTISSGHTITYDGDLTWTNGNLSLQGAAKLIVQGDFTVSGGSFNFNYNSDLEVSGDFIYQRYDLAVPSSGSLLVGGSLSVPNGSINVNSLGVLDVTGVVSVSGSLQNGGTISIGQSATIGSALNNNSTKSLHVGGDLTVSNTLNNGGSLSVSGSLIVTNGNLNVNNSAELNVTGAVLVNASLQNNGTIIIGQSTSVGGALNNNNPSFLHVGGDLTVSNTFNNNAIADIDGNLTMIFGDLNINHPSLIAIDRDLTKNNNITVNGTLVVGGNFIATGGRTTVNDGGLYYVFGSLDESAAQANCTSNLSDCFPNDACTRCLIRSGDQWIAENSPGNPYISYNPTSSWWEDHLANICESNGPETVCPASITSFQVPAATDNVGDWSSNTIEWAVYGGTITGFNGSSVATHDGTVNGHSASYQSVNGADGITTYTLSVQWEGIPFLGAYVAIRQSSDSDCPEGKWTVFYIHIQEATAPTGDSTQSFCLASNPKVADLTAIGTEIKWYSSPSGGTALATDLVLTSGTYYASQTISGGCESEMRFAVEVTIIFDMVWTGNESIDWNVPGNWSCEVLPDLSTDVRIPDVPNKPVLQNGNEGAAKNLVIDAGSSLTVVNNTMQIAGTIDNRGTFTATEGSIKMKGTSSQTIAPNVFAENTVMNLTIDNPAGTSLLGALHVTGVVTALNGNLSSEGHLTLVSSATQTALIDGAGTGDITGNVTMQRYLSSAFGYKYFSSPFQSATVNAFDDYLDLNASFSAFYTYDESKVTSGWENYTNSTGLLMPMQGYAANFGADASEKTVSITGIVNNNILSTLTLYNNNQPYTKGFNLVGNPYPSPIDWDASDGWTRVNIDNAVYYFNAGTTDQYTGTYSSYINGISSDGLASHVIAAMQGFFVHVSDGDYPVTASFGMDNRVRVNNINAVFQKAAHYETRPIIRLTAKYADDTNPGDPLVIYLNDWATEAFDKDLDALKLMNTDVTSPNFYTLSPDADRLSINAIPYPEIASEVSLGLKNEQDGVVSFEAGQIENIPAGLHIYLADKKTRINTELQQSGGYKLFLAAGVDEGRFSLILSEHTLSENQANNDAFIAYSSGDKLVVSFTGEIGEKGDLSIRNILGQELWRRQLAGTGTHELDVPLRTGVYVVSFSTGKIIYSKKIVINN